MGNTPSETVCYETRKIVKHVRVISNRKEIETKHEKPEIEIWVGKTKIGKHNKEVKCNDPKILFNINGYKINATSVW